MKTKIINLAIAFLILTTLPVALAQENQVFFSVILDYDSGTITQKEVKLIESIGELDKKSSIGDYKLRVYSFDGQVLYETNFDLDLDIFDTPPKEWFDDEGNQIIIPTETDVGSATVEETTKVLFVPYSIDAKEIRIEKDGRIELVIDVSEFTKPSAGISSVYIIGAIIAVIIIGVIIYLRRKKGGTGKGKKSSKGKKKKK